MGRYEIKIRNYAQTRKNAKNNYKHYTKDDIKLIMSRSMSDRELSKLIHRSVQSIQIKRSRVKHGL